MNWSWELYGIYLFSVLLDGRLTGLKNASTPTTEVQVATLTGKEAANSTKKSTFIYLIFSSKTRVIKTMVADEHDFRVVSYEDVIILSFMYTYHLY